MRPSSLAVAVVALLVTGSAVGQEARKATILQPNKAVRGEVKIGVSQCATFRIRVSDDAVMFEVRLSSAPANLDLHLRHGSPIKDAEKDADHAAATERSNEVVRVSRWSDPPLRPGIYYVDVSCPLDRPPLVGGRRAKAVPFEIGFAVVPARLQAAVTPGKPVTAETNQESGHVCMFTVDVPEGAACLRIDLGDVEGDLDVFVGRGNRLLEFAKADYVADGPQGREHLVIDAASDPPLRPGTYCICVVDGSDTEASVPFTLHASLKRDPPAELLHIPEMRVGETPFERALFATVELLGPAGGGSGAVVTADGLILTNYHVIEGVDGKPVGPGELIVALTLDPRKPAVELFRARVREADEKLDLALVEVATGFYGQPLPAGYVFRQMPLGDPQALKIGDSLGVMGYPGIGGTGSRPSITMTRGIVSGFEIHRHGSLIKTDAQLHAGTSGGAVLNHRHELIGVPSETMQESEGDAAGQIGFVRPLSLVPLGWRKLIDDRRNKK